MNEKLLQQTIWELQGPALNRQLRRAQAVKHLLKTHTPKLVLDIGCGEGFITSLLADGRTYVLGIDLDESIKIAKNKVKNAEFIRASITHLPFKDKCFEAVTLLEVLEHLPDSILKDGIKETDRILNEGGTLIISVPYKEEITYTVCIHCGKITPLWGHLHSMDEGKCKSLLPNHYTLTSKCHLPNVAILSLSRIFRHLPFRLWLVLNNLLGRARKGYWIVLKFKKDAS